MSHSGEIGFLRDALILMGFALAFVLLFRRAGLGATLGYLVAGVVVGPQVLGLVGGAEDKVDFAELGIVMLLFVVGLELAPQRLWRLKREILGLGFLQVSLCGVALIGVTALAISYPIATAVALGLPLALSSTAQVLPMLQSAGRLKTAFGERAFSILLFQDLSIIPLITLVAVLGREPGGADTVPAWQMALLAVAAIVGLIAAGRFLLRPLFRLIGRLGEREMFVVAALFTVLSAAAVMELLGLSAALGAFIAGLMLADTPYRHELEVDVEPFRSILLGLFFLAVGMMLDLRAIAENPLFVIAMAAGLIVVKTSVIFGLGLLFGMSWRAALALGLLLSQGGEFGFVLFTQGLEAQLVTAETVSLFGAVITLSMAATPVLMAVTRRLRREREGAETREGPRKDGASALVIGYGRFGQTVAQMLILSDIRVTLIDRDTELIDLAGDFGAKVYFGDGTRIDLLRQAGAREADILLFCLDGQQFDEKALASIAEAFPKPAIFLRAYDRRTLIELRDAKVDFTIREVFESAVTMARAALEELGDSIEEIDHAEDHYRRNDAERLELQKGEGDLRAGRGHSITQAARDLRRGD